MPAESQVSSASGAVELVASECNANGVIINVGDGYDGGGGGEDHSGSGSGGGEDHSGSGKQGFKVARDDAHDKSNVNVSINDNSAIPIAVPVPGYDGNGNCSKEGLTEDLPNRKHDPTDGDHASLGKADDYSDDNVDTLKCDSLNKADDSSPDAAVEVILEKGTVSGERDSMSSAASEPDDQETEVASLTLEKEVENTEPAHEDLQGPDLLVNGNNSLVLDPAAASLDDNTESMHVNCEHHEDGILVSSISNKSSDGVVDSEPAVSVKDHQDPEVDTCFSLDSVVNEVDSPQLDLATTESGCLIGEPEGGILVSICGESVEVDDFRQSVSTEQQTSDAHDKLLAGTELIIQNRTAEDSAVYNVVEPEPSPVPEDDNRKPENADIHSVVSIDITRYTDESQEGNLVLFSYESLEADVSQSATTNQQNDATDDFPVGIQEILQNREVGESISCELVDHDIGSETSPATRHDDQESKVSASILESDVDVENSHKPESAVDESHEDNLVSISSKSPEADASQSTSTDQQKFMSFDEFVEDQECDTTCPDPQQAEVQLDKEFINIVQQAKPQVPEQLESSSANVGETGIQEEAKIELSSGPHEHQQTFDTTVESVPSGLDKETQAERSEYEVNLTTSTETSLEIVPNHIRDHLSVPSSSGGFRDVEELNKLNESSAPGYSLSPICQKEEFHTVGKPVDSVLNVQKFIGDDKFQHEANVEELCNPENEVNVDSLAKLPETPREKETVLDAAIFAENNLITTDGVIEPATYLGSVSCISPEGGISSPACDERYAEIVPSKDASGDKLVHGMHQCSSDSTTPITEFELGITDSSTKVSSHHVDNAYDIPEVVLLDEPADSVPSHAEAKPGVEEMGSAAMDCEDSAPSYKSEVSDSSIAIDEDVPNSILEIKDGERKTHQLPVIDIQSDDKLIGEEDESMVKLVSKETSMPCSDSSTGDALASQDASAGLLTRPFHFLIKIPRFDDSNIREQINQAHLLVEEKTKIRDDFGHEMEKLKENCSVYSAECKAAWSNVRSSKQSLKSKRAEIESLQAMINKVKNAISVDDIDARIRSMEHMIQHETLPLKEEKQFIHEIKQLKQHREQLSSSIGNHDEVKQALNKRGEIEERLKILKKELEHLKDEVFKKAAIARAAEKKFEDENIKLKGLKSQFEEANHTRQSAWQRFRSLKNELYDKKELFRKYKENAAAASDFAARGDVEALYHLCDNQVETIMDFWNKDDEFRQEYVKRNVRSTVWRFGTLDGRSLGSDEEPPVLPSFERRDRSVSKLTNIVSAVETPVPKQVNQTKPVENVLATENDKVTLGEKKNQTTKSAEVAKQALENENGPTVSQVRGRNDEIGEKVYVPTKEELELERKAEELRKTESEAKLREHRRVEEKLKALEAVERKKRNAEKALMRAEIRAQKEAEQKEKEREKRLRKKERKKGNGSEVSDGNNTGESTPSSEILAETIKETEVKDALAASSAPKRPQKPSVITKQNKAKSIPSALRNRNKKKMQQWIWIILTCLLIIVLFVLGNVGFFSNLSNLKHRNHNSL